MENLKHYVSGLFFAVAFVATRVNIYFGIIALAAAGVAYWSLTGKKQKKNSLPD